MDAQHQWWIPVVFGTLSVLGAIVSLFSTWHANRNSFRLQWTRDVVAWGTKVVEVVSRAQYLCKAKTKEDADALPSRRELAASLSALIDEGRFFFENKRIVDYGNEKEPAYQGVRPRLLTQLVVVHDLLMKATIPSTEEITFDAIGRARRRFVSDLQQIINPAWLSRQASYERDVQKHA